MTNYAATATHLPDGVNRANRRLAKAVVPTAMSSSDTLTITAPAGADWSLVPIALETYTLSGTTYTRLADTLTVTTHVITTGVTVLTANGAGAAQYAKVIIDYGPID